MSLPPAVADERRPRRSSQVFSQSEITTVDRLHAQSGEKIVGGHCRCQYLRSSASAHHHLVLGVPSQTVKHLVLCPPVQEVRVRGFEPREYLHFSRLIDVVQARGITIRQRPDQSGIDKGKDGNRSGDSQGEGNERSYGEPRRPQKAAHRVSKILG